ncbi:MAG: hypothetical protein ROZ36_16315 [Thermincola sp.]|nr:hypothetical protein [Thermincola sp.]
MWQLRLDATDCTDAFLGAPRGEGDVLAAELGFCSEFLNLGFLVT